MSDTATTLGAHLRQVRKERGLSQEQLAQCAGLAQSAISAFETDEKVPRLGTLQRLSACLEISTSVLLGDAEAIAQASA